MGKKPEVEWVRDWAAGEDEDGFPIWKKKVTYPKNEMGCFEAAAIGIGLIVFLGIVISYPPAVILLLIFAALAQGDL